MKLYSYYRSSCSYRVRIALHHKNLPFEYMPVHLVKDGGEQLTEGYSKLNPKKEVPTLVDKNITLAQSTAIFLYLDRMYIDTPLFPKELPFFEKCLELVEIINSGTQPIQNLKVLKKLKSDFNISDDQKTDWVRYFIKQGLEAYQAKLTPGSKFSLGDEVTAADMFLVPQLYNAHRFNVDMSSLKHLLEIEKNCLELGAFKKAHPSTQPDAE
ncbi:MAG: maleylacetoacetate isomerase [Bdellovibrionales bacterium]